MTHYLESWLLSLRMERLGNRGGVAAKLRDTCPWLIDVWCMPHRLDLAVRKMVQKCPPAAQVIDVLELVYKTYLL